MPDRRHATSSSSNSRNPAANSTTSVRRNLFQHHLTRRPTTSSTSTSISQSNSAETLRLDVDPESDSSDIVIRDKNGEFEIEDLPVEQFDEQEDGGGGGDTGEDEKERQRLADAVRHHQRDRNRAPSEPAELLEAVRASLRAKVNALAEDNWMYEAEDDAPLR
ncbi:hypothetical protein ONS95_013325 [Cadophora gregata]|uniref:uncharacterized protein n=1 Tax=Cadophora gregata TaxID=51156 RepID=UPI0026DB3A36|nr:uncharacterized protein ONS95_013325 [Cadophora gregata]KAK0099847.1 hypothetical protein ONS96_007800 [Cadophora gregata f. sp. sojae]KAK0116304.1 hypothetical protein ONS95_013325 [Cadophora gregata]